MKLRLIVFAVIAALIAAAVLTSFRAKPAGATSIVCNPVLVPNLAPKSKRIQRV